MKIRIQIITLLFITFSYLSVTAQTSSDFFADTTQQFSVSLGANYTYGSSVVNSAFLNKFIFGGKIERADKDEAYHQLSNENRVGGDFNFGLKVEIPLDTFFKKTNVSLIVGVENNVHFDAQFSSDLFQFTFDGNKQFEGERIDIGKTNFNYYTLQKLNLGLVKYNKFNGVLAKEGLSINLIKGQESQFMKITEGSIFTAEYGKEIEVDLNYRYHSSDTAKTGIAAFNGVGVTTDLFAEFILKNGDKVYLGVNDLGFVRWNNNSIKIAADSNFHFEGIVVDNVFDLNDSLVSNISRDSIIDDISTENTKTSYLMAMPASVNINYTKVFNEKWKINVGFYHKILSNYVPLISVNGYYYFNPKLVVRGHVSYGGYGKLNTGLAFSKAIKKHFDIFIGTNNIEAFIKPNSAYSNSGFIGLKAYF
jgi:hypothetical protein